MQPSRLHRANKPTKNWNEQAQGWCRAPTQRHLRQMRLPNFLEKVTQFSRKSIGVAASGVLPLIGVRNKTGNAKQNSAHVTVKHPMGTSCRLRLLDHKYIDLKEKCMLIMKLVRGEKEKTWEKEDPPGNQPVDPTKCDAPAGHKKHDQ